MLFQKFTNNTKTIIGVEYNNQWWDAGQFLNIHSENILDYLRHTHTIQTVQWEQYTPIDLDKYVIEMPFKPTAYRDFMLFEKHAIDAGRGFVKKYMPLVWPVLKIYEGLLRRPFPFIKPKKRYYQYPIYYLGNHLNFYTHGQSIKKPQYTQELDYELELAAVIDRPLYNATQEQATEAIAGFVILNDFTARDEQLSEMNSGFGPMKTKNFANAISSVVASANQILPIIDQLKVGVTINGQKIISSTTAHMKYTIGQAIAYASWEEPLYAGELFGMGTVPGCAAIENDHWLFSGDQITLTVESIGTLTNTIV